MDSAVLAHRRVAVVWAAFVLFASIGLAAAAPAHAYSAMKVTSGNLSILKSYGSSAYYHSTWKYVLYRRLGVKLVAYGQSEPSGTYYQIGDGKCITAARSLANKNTVRTTKWVRGVNVIANKAVAPGTVIATFPGGTYDPTRYPTYTHTAIFKRYVRNAAGVITGIEVWDQNFVARYKFGKHTLARTGFGVRDADWYHVVLY
jgi:hypothetical protein